MRCNDARARMSAYLDSELDAGSTYEIAEHLECCSPCCQRFDAESVAEAAIAEKLCCDEMPDPMWSELCCAVTGRRRRFWPWVLGLSAAIVVVGGVVLWNGERDFSTSDEQQAREVLSAFLETARGDGAWATSGGSWVDIQAPDSGSSDPTLYPMLSGMAFDLARVDSDHATRLLSLRRHVEDGVEVLDVRLRCCGEPVLLRLVRDPAGGALGVAIEDGEVHPVLSVSEGSGTQVVTRRIGDMVAIGVSRHPIEQVLEALRLA